MIYTVTSTLPEQHGGRTKSLLSRIKLLQDELGVQSTILTTNYNINYPDIYEVFRKRDVVHENTQFENIYDWLSGYKLFDIKKTLIINKPKITESEVDIEGLTAERVDDDTVRYYKGDEYTLYRKFHEDSRVLKFEDFMSPISKKKVERRSYNKYGDLHQITRYDPKTFHKISEEFYDVHGDVYCINHYTIKDDEPRLSLIELLKDDRPYKFFAMRKNYSNIISKKDSVKVILSSMTPVCSTARSSPMIAGRKMFWSSTVPTWLTQGKGYAAPINTLWETATRLQAISY
ncbi:hypothetical protein GCM10022378_19310 [Salinicoccus jeotgali]|uniref:Uncharacterized protein n=1 Tax=Salinicoccus jeotgali TaxID=381634 RepID=A0ABP7F4H4_9STAP